MHLRTPARLRVLDWALRLAGAHRIIPAALKRRFLGLGLEPDDLHAVLRRIRGLEDWPTAWVERAEHAVAAGADATERGDPGEARRHLRLACGAALLGMGLSDPISPRRRACQDLIRDAHARLATFAGGRFETFELSWEGRPVRGFLRRPEGDGPHPLTVLLPPLGHIKEELGVAFEGLVTAGHAVAGLDLPGSGESRGPLPLDAQRVVSAALDRLLARGDLDPSRVAVCGISLGAYWAFKSAAEDPRLRLAVGISTPVMNRRAWRRLPPHLWRAFQGVFATSDPGRARSLAMRLTLEGVFQRVRCPVLLFHAGRDHIPIPGVVPWLLARARVPAEVVVLPRARHGCVDDLPGRIVPQVARHLERVFSQEAPAAHCPTPRGSGATPAAATFSARAV